MRAAGPVMLLAVMLGWACKDDPLIVPLIVRARFSPHTDNVLLGTVHVALREPAFVEVVCETDGLTQRFSGTTSASQDIALSGLLASSSYDCLVHADGETSRLSFTTGAPPTDLPLLSLEGDPLEIPFDYVVLTTALFCEPQPDDVAHAMILDRYGRLRWYRSLDEWVADAVATRLSGGDLLVSALSGYDPGQIRLADQTIVAVAPPANDGSKWYHHELHEREDGTWLALGNSTDVQGGVSWTGFEVLVIDPASGEFPFRWRSQEAVDAGTLPSATEEQEGNDLYHANSVIDVEDADGAGFLVSLFRSEAIVRLDPVSRELDWKLGPGLDFELTEGTWFAGQHALGFHDGVLALYDNHNVQGSKSSRAVEFAVDVGARTLREIWSHEIGDYYFAFGDFDRLDESHVMIASSKFFCESDLEPSEIRVVRKDEVIWKLTAPSGQILYRAEAWNDAELFGDQ